MYTSSLDTRWFIQAVDSKIMVFELILFIVNGRRIVNKTWFLLKALSEIQAFVPTETVILVIFVTYAELFISFLHLTNKNIFFLLASDFLYCFPIFQ